MTAALLGLLLGKDTALAQQPPVITQQPHSQTNFVGGMASFAVQASGSPTLTYQWLVNGTNLVDNARITGSQTASITITGVQTVDAGDYRVVVTNIYGSATSSVATLLIRTIPTLAWLNPAPITYGTALSSNQLNASASVPGTFIYNPAAGTVLNSGTNVLTVNFTPTDTTRLTLPVTLL